MDETITGFLLILVDLSLSGNFNWEGAWMSTINLRIQVESNACADDNCLRYLSMTRHWDYL